MYELIARVIQALDMLFNLAVLFGFIILAMVKGENKEWQEIMAIVGWCAIGWWIIKKVDDWWFAPFQWLFG